MASPILRLNGYRCWLQLHRLSNEQIHTPKRHRDPGKSSLEISAAELRELSTRGHTTGD